MRHAQDLNFTPVPLRIHAHGGPVPVQQPVQQPVRAPALLQVDADIPELTPARSLNGWQREFCVELRGEEGARIFVRAVQRSSFKAAELQQAILFHRLDPRFRNLAGCVDALQVDLQRLAVTARRAAPSKANLFITLEYDRAAWDRVEQGVDRWSRRCMT